MVTISRSIFEIRKINASSQKQYQHHKDQKFFTLSAKFEIIFNSRMLTPESKLLSKQATNHAYFTALKIWDQLDRWLKSHGQKLPQMIFLAITFESVVRLFPNFELDRKICMAGGLFAKSLWPYSQYPGPLFSDSKFRKERWKTSFLGLPGNFHDPFVALTFCLISWLYFPCYCDAMIDREWSFTVHQVWSPSCF